MYKDFLRSCLSRAMAASADTGVPPMILRLAEAKAETALQCMSESDAESLVRSLYNVLDKLREPLQIDRAPDADDSRRSA